jgi:hypothetical protein
VGMRDIAFALKSFIYLFLPVTVAALGLGIRRSRPTLGYALIVVAAAWMVVGFVIRRRASA